MMVMMMMKMIVLYVVQAKLWQCFLEGATNRLRHQYVHGASVDVIGVDAAKLACCVRADTTRCRLLCQQVRTASYVNGQFLEFNSTV